MGYRCPDCGLILVYGSYQVGLRLPCLRCGRALTLPESERALPFEALTAWTWALPERVNGLATEPSPGREAGKQL